jgi:hypothetical protein
MPSDFFLFILLGAALVATVYGIWRYWESLVERTPEEDAYDKQVATLNERQANRMSDERLTHPLSDDDAWQVILQRGRKLMRRGSRYGGDYDRRTRERRSRDQRP